MIDDGAREVEAADQIVRFAEALRHDCAVKGLVIHRGTLCGVEAGVLTVVGNDENDVCSWR